MYSERNKCLCIQQVPEEIERVLVGIQAYLSIRRHTSDSGLSFFEDDESGGDVEKVNRLMQSIYPHLSLIDNFWLRGYLCYGH